ncbi:hypothetical protein MMC13_002791 [Lambiella insularis]|nr:hypothetical protein [Lambiella insularis]
MAFTAPAEGEWLSSNGRGGDGAEGPPESPTDAQPPQHPVSTMQGAFEESMMETMTELDEPEVDTRYSNADSFSRRKMLLEQEKYERTVAGRWKQKPGEKFHPLWKLVAQISFGMHLLQQGMAKSDDEVLKILQTHVDEVDGFLERTTEDFDLAQNDIHERIRYLQLPLEHGDVFDTMLDDRPFRMAIVEGNEKIEHIVDRTEKAMKDALKDIQKGLDATRELSRYLTRIEKTWKHRSEEHTSVYQAMTGNTEGWSRAFMTLQQKGHTLGVALVQLSGIIAEIQRRAGIASRRNVMALQSTERSYSSGSKPFTTSSRHSQSPSDSSPKSLPVAPTTTEGVTRTPRANQHAISGSQHVSRQTSTDELQKALKASARSKLRRSSSREVAWTPSQSNTNSTSPTEGPGSSSKPLSRRVSFSKRTRSLTRRIPFMKESEDVNGASESRSQSLSISGHLSPQSGSRTPMSNAQSPRTPQSEWSVSENAGASPARSSRRSAEPPLMDSRRSASPANASVHLSTSTRSDSTGSSSVKRLNSIMARPKVVTINSSSSATGNASHPVLKTIQAREVRFSTTAPDSTVKSAQKDLPLRHYRSQESLPALDQRDTIDSKISSTPIRTSSIRDSSSTKSASARGSLGSVLEDQSSTKTPASGQHSRQPSSTHRQDTQTAAQPPPPSAETMRDTTLASSVHSPDNPTSSPYSFSLSPYTTMLSPVPAQSSAAPSPLRVANKPSLEVSEPASNAPEAVPAEQTPASQDPAYIPVSAVPITAYTSTIAPQNSLPRPSSSLEVLTSATVSGPEPDINPYDIPRSDTTTPISTKPATTAAPAEKVSIPQSPPLTTPSRPTFSPFPSSRPPTASSRSQVLHNGFSSPGLSPPRTFAIVSTSNYSKDEALPLEKGSKSPWKKVFGHGIGKSIGSMGRGHRKNRSDISVSSERPMTSDTTNRRGGDDGFLGAGKEGVWISRKNFLKT